MSELMECRACFALADEGERVCPQCGSSLLGGVGEELAQQLVVRHQQEEFVATYCTWSDGHWSGVGVDLERNRLAVRYRDGHRNVRKVIQGDKIIGVKVVESTGVTHTKTKGGSQLGRAVLGGVMLGGVGALLGGLSAKQQSTGTVAGIEVLITTREPGWPLVTITTLAGEYPANSGVVVQGRRAAEVWAARIEELIRQCASKGVAAASGLGGSIADELGKLVWLRDRGEITQQEFELLKGQLLANCNAS
ncbi:SHOCT domain-containing protein [Aeromonas salmonicida]|uniref:SHOCT domain-containing protein n=1 Tax=Aeromonas salmonicida TaxID=645 RepID=UPI00259E2F81|nr:SHOCT domain-containing protein [Aeromonas salmonicida]MDM5112793.1 SHOCT domain-containing protein [Aeromonas salmonicida]